MPMNKIGLNIFLEDDSVYLPRAERRRRTFLYSVDKPPQNAVHFSNINYYYCCCCCCCCCPFSSRSWRDAAVIAVK